MHSTKPSDAQNFGNSDKSHTVPNGNDLTKNGHSLEENERPVVQNIMSSCPKPSTQSKQIPSLSSVPLDGGYGWVIVFVSFMAYLIGDGISFSFGILFVEFVNYFQESKATTSWVGSIFLNMPPIGGPIASYLSDRYGGRKVCIAGGLLSAGAFIASSFANTLAVLFVTFALAGLGLAFSNLTSTVSVANYFEKKRSLAIGLAACGTGVGTFAFPPIVTYLLEEYAWQGTLLILAGFFLNIVVFGALMRPLEQAVSNGNRSCISENSIPETSNSAGSERLRASAEHLTNCLRDHPKIQTQGKTKIQSETEISCEEGGSVHLNNKANSQDSIENPTKNVNLPSSTSKCDPECLGTTGDKSRCTSSNSSVARRDSSLFRSMCIHRGSLCYPSSVMSIPRRASICAEGVKGNTALNIENGKKKSCMEVFKKNVLSVFDFSLFKNVRYTLVCISNVLLCTCSGIPYVYIPDLADTLGIDKERASFLISIIGILYTIGVVIIGYVDDKSWIDTTVLFSILVTISGLLLGSIPWISDYNGLGAICGFYGFTSSANRALIPIMLVNLITVERFNGGFGMLLLIQGIVSLAGPPIAGMLFDMTGNYNITFLSTGLCIIMSAIMVFPFDKIFSYNKGFFNISSDKNPVEEVASRLSVVKFKGKPV